MDTVVEDREFFKVVQNDSRITETGFAADFGSNCPVPQPSAPFVGWATIKFKPNQWVVEYITFQEWVRSVGVVEGLSLEQVTRRIFDAVWEAIEPLELEVRCEANSAAHPKAWATVRKGEMEMTGVYYPHPDSDYWRVGDE